jgi:hypothetical protein
MESDMPFGCGYERYEMVLYVDLVHRRPTHVLHGTNGIHVVCGAGENYWCAGSDRLLAKFFILLVTRRLLAGDLGRCTMLTSGGRLVG